MTLQDIYIPTNYLTAHDLLLKAQRSQDVSIKSRVLEVIYNAPFWRTLTAPQNRDLRGLTSDLSRYVLNFA